GRFLELGHARHVDAFAALQDAGEQQLAIVELMLQFNLRGAGLDADQFGAGRQFFLLRRRLLGLRARDQGGGGQEDRDEEKTLPDSTPVLFHDPFLKLKAGEFYHKDIKDTKEHKEEERRTTTKTCQPGTPLFFGRALAGSPFFNASLCPFVSFVSL